MTSDCQFLGGSVLFCFCCQRWHCVCVFLLRDWQVWDYLLLVFLWMQLTSLVWNFPYSIFCRAGFVERYCLNLVGFFSWTILFSLVTESIAGYSILGWHLWFLCVYTVPDQVLLAFIVSNEKLGVIRICLPLYATWPFSFDAFNILSLFCMFNVLIIKWQGSFFFWSRLFGVL